MYDARAAKYNDSWHPKFAQSLIELLDLQPGESVLDLACGTGLATFAAASKVGTNGSVIGIDVSDGMLGEAKARLEKEKKEYPHVSFYNHNITDLSSLEEIKEGTFDAITCASAIVLLKDPGAALKQWAKYLKSSGRLFVDCIHPRNLLSSTVFERTHLRLGLEPPSYREWIKSEDSFKTLMADSGFDLEKSKFDFMEQVGFGTRYREVEEADAVFAEGVKGPHSDKLRAEGNLEKARKIFREEWAAMADTDGKLSEVDGVWVTVARKSQNSIPNPVAAGSCACGGVTWTATSAPTSSNFCYCITCRKISGGPFLAFMDFPQSDITFSVRKPLQASSLKTMSISPNADRGFCIDCGSTISMVYRAESDRIGITIGSMDEDKSQPGIMDHLATKHIFVKDTPSWYKIPDDGSERQETMESAERLLVHK